MLAIQSNGVKWVHQDPVVKSQRLTDANGVLQAVVELDPWGGETTRSWQQGQQPQRYTTYLRDGNRSDDAKMRRYNRWWSRFDQPDPYDGSYDLIDPQSFNRYAYTESDPVNNTDPTGLFCPRGGCEPENDPAPDYSGLWSLIFGRAGMDRVLEMPVGNEGGGEGVTIELPQNTGQTPAPNPNCIQNAVRGSTGLARPFGNVNTNPNSPGFGRVGHDGVHAVAPAGSKVTTLPALTGKVIDIHTAEDGTKIVDVLLDNGMVGLYKDLTTVNVSPKQRLNAGSLIGRTGGVGDARNFSGLHFSLLLGGMKGHDYYRDITKWSNQQSDHG